MKRIKISALALVAIFVFGAIMSSAFAEEEPNAEWLAAGAVIPAAQAATTSITMLLDESVVGGKAAVLCVMLLDGTVGPGMEDLTTKMLNTAGEEISELSTGLGLACEAKETCATGTDTELRPEGLPWETLVDLMNPSGKFLDLIHIGLVVSCLIFNIDVEDLCEGLTSSELKNVAGGVEPIYSVAAESALLECNQGGEDTGSITTEGSPLITLNGGAALTVSE